MLIINLSLKAKTRKNGEKTRQLNYNMKDCANDISPYISTLFNISLASGFVPPTLKEACITPIVKKPQLERTDINNYRPISNLSVTSKLL